MRYTTDPATFIPPTDATIKHIARREGLGELTPEEMDFVWDLLAKTAGAEVRKFDEAEAQADAAAHAFSEANAFLIRTGRKVETYFERELVERFEQQYHFYQHQRYDALVQVDLNQLPGYNKPTQAVRLLWLFRSMQYLWLLYVVQMEYSAGFVDSLVNALTMLDMLDPEQFRMLESFIGGDEPTEDATALGLELSVKGVQVAEMLQIARKLNDLADLKDKSKLTADPNGEETILRNIEEIRELGKASQSAFALPKQLRMQRAISGELDVRNPHTRRAPKQLLFMVVDGTGSMLHNQQMSASRAAGVVMNRLQAVIDGDAELYLRFFDRTLREEEYHADSPESARELLRIVSDAAQYTGNWTEFTNTLKVASVRAEEILRTRNLRDPEIVFVTDGQAEVPDLSVLDGKVLHAIQVGTKENVLLSALARRSGGIAVHTSS